MPRSSGRCLCFASTLLGWFCTAPAPPSPRFLIPRLCDFGVLQPWSSPRVVLPFPRPREWNSQNCVRGLSACQSWRSFTSSLWLFHDPQHWGHAERRVGIWGPFCSPLSVPAGTGDAGPPRGLGTDIPCSSSVSRTHRMRPEAAAPEGPDLGSSSSVVISPTSSGPFGCQLCYFKLRSLSNRCQLAGNVPHSLRYTEPM